MIESRYVYAETPAGDYVCTLSQGARGDQEAAGHQQTSLALARTMCSQLALELAAIDPPRAAALADAAADPRRTAHELWGAYKNDERAPRESQIESENRIR